MSFPAITGYVILHSTIFAIGRSFHLAWDGMGLCGTPNRGDFFTTPIGYLPCYTEQEVDTSLDCLFTEEHGIQPTLRRGQDQIPEVRVFCDPGVLCQGTIQSVHVGVSFVRYEVDVSSHGLNPYVRDGV